MKKTNFTLIVLLSIVFLSSCYDTKVREIKQTIKIPIYEYTTQAEAEANLKQQKPQDFTTFGKIYIYNNYLLINERGIGIHIYDNSNPAIPVQVSFMNIPGNLDMAINNSVLYVDSYDDFLVLDISDISNIQLLKRMDGIFPQSHPKFNGVIIGYKDTVIITEERINPDFGWFGNQDNNSDNVVALNSISEINSSGGFNNGGTGTGGSFARFTISKNHLFAIDNRNLNNFDLALANDPILVNSTPIYEVQEIETLFPYNDHLFIGSTNGLVIYDITDPNNISFESVFSHATACDPVYVQDDVAYVTLRTNLNNPRCFGNLNQLDILDVSSVNAPQLVQSFPMINPHGVGVDGNLLFVCEASSGLKIYNVTKQSTGNKLDSVAIQELAWKQDIKAYDVIPNNGILIAVGDNTLKQYNYGDPSNIYEISSIK
jgi:hypothetical protein